MTMTMNMEQFHVKQDSDITNIVLVPSNFFEIIDEKTENKVYNDIDNNGYVYLLPCDNGKYNLERWTYVLNSSNKINGIRVRLTDSSKPKPKGCCFGMCCAFVECSKYSVIFRVKNLEYIDSKMINACGKK